jgi:hypothetical protein
VGHDSVCGGVIVAGMQMETIAKTRRWMYETAHQPQGDVLGVGDC